ncbi:MAG: rhomboid family intramembrane serine protease, partial [Solirubrobacterales bacterium]
MIPLKDNIPTSRFAVVTAALIVINVAVFAWQLSFSSDLDKQPDPGLRTLGISERDENSVEYGAIPYRILHPGKECAAGVTSASATEATVVCEGTADFAAAEREAVEHPRQTPLVALDEAPWWETIFSSMFMHGGLLHIAFNMLFLWIFGNNVEDAMGRVKFAIFYLAAGVAALYSQAAIDPSATVPTIGASGAVAGVLGAYALLHPRARILTLIFIIFFVTLVEIPALVMLGIWFILQFLPAVGQVATPEVGGGGVAYFAH